MPDGHLAWQLGATVPQQRAYRPALVLKAASGWASPWGRAVRAQVMGGRGGVPGCHLELPGQCVDWKTAALSLQFYKKHNATTYTDTSLETKRKK